MRAVSVAAVLAGLGALAGCGDDASSDGSSDGGAGGTGATGATGGLAAGGQGTGGAGECGPDGPGPDETLPDATDPEMAMFTLEEALVGLPPGDGPLRAIITTEVGVITCELFPDKAPNGVANFVGLARGTRAWREQASGTWVKRRFYDGLTFHRIIDDFMAQGGDQLGTGAGSVGYGVPGEPSDLLHEPGTLAYAHRGSHINGSQFYITEVTTDHLDGDYTTFGRCTPLETIQALAATPVGPDGETPVDPPHTETIEITRCPL